MNTRGWSQRLGIAPGGHEREYMILLFLILIQGFSWCLILPMLPLYSQHLGASPAMVGLIMAVPALFQWVFSIPGGLIAASRGMRYVFLWSFTCGAVAALVYYVAPTASWLFVAQLFFGLSHALFWPSEGAYLGNLADPKDRSRLIGFTLGLNAFTFALGPAIAGILMDSVRINAAYALYLSLMAVGLVLALRLPGGRRRLSPVGTGRTLLRSLGDIGIVLASKGARIALIGASIMYLVRGVFDSFFPLYAEGVGVSPTQLGLLLGGLGAAVAVLRFGSSWAVRLIGVRALLVTGVAATSLTMLLLPLARVPILLWGVVLLMGLGPGSVPVTANTIITGDLEERYRPVGMATYETFAGIGRFVGPAAFGYVAQAAGVDMTFYSAGLLTLLGAAGLAVAAAAHGPISLPVRRLRRNHGRSSTAG